ncbi:hypothetical protein MVEN_00931100 [Mycena venus]|uniref:Uncharacterized protein n=1 Tax=Mycena venus TaxID=2733690 RepID=A0A8H6YCM3_9AGAR|nr:hypothetical protein MVEN_00931100 [Mycena venus]
MKKRRMSTRHQLHFCQVYKGLSLGNSQAIQKFPLSPEIPMQLIGAFAVLFVYVGLAVQAMPLNSDALISSRAPEVSDALISIREAEVDPALISTRQAEVDSAFISVRSAEAPHAFISLRETEVDDAL